jgi:threonylcarbamoyladenosine tRNA methylthiotransferase MtaB
MSSRPFDEALSEARDLAERGHKEIVLTGIRLGRYDFGLSDLIRAISELPGVERIRLSSIELTDIPPDLLDLMASDRKVCRHLHVPLQSGDDEILARMRRPYTAAEYESFARRARRLVPEIGLTTDIMVGFPGETEAQFEKTCVLAETLRFSRIHVFPYSPRPGTAAFEMRDDVSPAEKARRKARMLDLGSELADEFAERMVGTTVKVLAESGGSGLTDNYVRTRFAGAAPAGEIVHVRIESVSGGVAHGRVASKG